MRIYNLTKHMVRIAAVVFTAPASLVVSASLYPGQGALVRWAIQISALVLVEGALVAGWYGLDNRRATSAERVLYSALAGAAYVTLWVIALQHGEGVVGLFYRATLGVLLLHAAAEAGVLASVRRERAADRSITSTRRVKRAARRAASETAIHSILLDNREAQARREAEHEAVLAEIAQQRRQTGAQRPSERRAPVRVPASNQQQRARRRRLVALVAQQPDQHKTELGKLLDCSRDTVARDLKALAAQGVVVPDSTDCGYRANGRHHEVAA